MAAGKLGGSVGLSPDSGHQGDLLSPTEDGFLTAAWFSGPGQTHHDVGYSQVNNSAVNLSVLGQPPHDLGNLSGLESTAATTGDSFKLGLSSISHLFNDDSLFADFNTCSYLANNCNNTVNN